LPEDGIFLISLRPCCSIASISVPKPLLLRAPFAAGIGYCVAILSMITAAIVEVFRLRAVANAGLTDVK